jgi:hypothetical protein
VDGGRITAGGLGEPAGGAAGRRGEVDADFLGFENFDESAEDGGFTGAGAAGEDGEFMGERVAECGALRGGEGKAGFLFDPLDGGVGLDGREPAGSAREPGDGGGDFYFSAVVVRQLDEAGAGQRSGGGRGGGLAGGLEVGGETGPMADDRFRLDEGGDAGFEEARFGFEEGGGVVD